MANAAGAQVATARVKLVVDRDDAFFVEVRGHEALWPVLARNPDASDEEIAPFAMTGAVWLDADGDGRSLGR
jgi:hypothetical protein